MRRLSILMGTPLKARAPTKVQHIAAEGLSATKAFVDVLLVETVRAACGRKQ